MAASTDIIPSIDFRMYVGGTAVGGAEGATLTLGQNNPRTAPDASAGWTNGVYGARSWSLAANGIYYQSSLAINGSTLAPTVAGTAMKGVREVTMDFGCVMGETVNSTTLYDRKITPGPRTVTVSIAVDYYDPLGTGADTQADLLDELNGSTSSGLTLVVPFGSTFSLTLTNAFVTGGTIEKANEETVRQVYTFASRGTVTAPTTTNLEAPVAALFTGLFAACSSTPVTVLLAHAPCGTKVDESTEYTGSAYVESLALRVPYEGAAASFDVTLQGNGALTRQMYEAP